MKKNHSNRFCLAVVGVLFAAMTLAVWCAPARASSDSERRPLAQRPDLTLSALSSGSFMTDFETYTQDQFPLRDGFRTLKSLFAYGVLRQQDNNGIYLSDGFAAQLEYPLDRDSLAHAADRFNFIYDAYLSGAAENICLAIVPDKGYFLAEEHGFPAMDYAALVEELRAAMPWARYIDLFPALSIDNYYRTDTHWRQETLLGAAEVLAAGLGVTLSETYAEMTLDRPFYGVYYGQSALPLEPDALRYLTSSLLDGCVVTDHESGTVGGVYDLEKAAGKDPYELFLSGPLPLVTVENPAASGGRRLVVFRDSFASSIVPLLAEGYAEITLVDVRYLRADLLDRFVDFDGADVLFLYSTLVLNNSSTIA